MWTLLVLHLGPRTAVRDPAMGRAFEIQRRLRRLPAGATRALSRSADRAQAVGRGAVNRRSADPLSGDQKGLAFLEARFLLLADWIWWARAVWTEAVEG